MKRLTVLGIGGSMFLSTTDASNKSLLEMEVEMEDDDESYWDCKKSGRIGQDRPSNGVKENL